MKIWFDRVTLADAKALTRWWNGIGDYANFKRVDGAKYEYFSYRRSETNRRLWAVIAHKREKTK